MRHNARSGCPRRAGAAAARRGELGGFRSIVHRRSRWTGIGFTGGAISHSSSSGTGALPLTGIGSSDQSCGATTRVVSSWVIGDGAALLNQALSSFRVTQQIAPLDAVAQSVFAKRRSARPSDSGFRGH